MPPPLLRRVLSALPALLAAGCVSAPPAPRSARLPVPAIVQKTPAYCAPATLARAMSFAGRPVPQGLLALAGGCSPDGGSDLESFYRALAPTLRNKGLRLRPLVSIDAARAVRIARVYGRLAEPRGKAPLPIPAAAGAAEIDLARLFGRADPALLREATRGRLPAFRSAVVREIAAGRPLLWGVVLGIVPEPHVAGGSRAGHLRLVVGYEDGGGTILYSDPWGPDCAVKRMSAADACAITQSLHVLEGRSAGHAPGPRL